MIHFEEILEKVEAYNPNSDQELLRRAYVFSAREHKGQVRRSGEPYLVHPLNVASILAELKADDLSIVVGLLHDVLEDTLTTKASIAAQFGDGGRRARRRPDEDRQVLLRLPRGGAGRDVPQDDPGDDLGPADRPGQAGGPAPQHAHARVPARVQAAGDRPRDARHLRADRPPAGHGEREGRARGPGVPLPRARGAPAPGPRGRPADEGLGGDDRRHPAAARGAAGRCRRPGRGLRTDEALLLDLVENEADGCGGRAALRHPRLPHRRARDPRLLRGPRDGPPALAPGARTDQGLRRDAEAQFLPVPAYHGDRRDGAALRDPDPHPRDGPDCGARNRGPLEVQRRPARAARRRRPLPVAAPARRLAERGLGPAPVPVALSRSTSTRTRSTRSRPGARCSPSRAARRRSTSPTASTPTSVTGAWARASTGSSCPCGRRSRAGTSSRS